MKVYLSLAFLIILLNLSGCKESLKETKIVKIKKKTEIKKTNIISSEAETNKKKIASQNHYSLYVSAKSGLNYRDKPKGKVLGKFPINKLLKVVEDTKILDKVIDEGKTLKGKWLGIEKEKDTVYVLSLIHI